MKAKFVFGGSGAKVPGTDFGLSVAIFKLWLAPTGRPFKGYTTASNQGLLGLAVIETPIVDFVMKDLEDEEPFFELHGSTADVTISGPFFVKDHGISTIKMTIKLNDGSPPRELTFFSDECKGYSASIGDIHFLATLLALPANEQDPTGVSFVPW